MQRHFVEDVREILVDASVTDEAIVSRVCGAFPAANVQTYAAGERAAAIRRVREHPKHVVALSRHDGAFVKPFPRHPWYQYDHMFNLLLGFNCFASCQYCFIHTYFDDAFPTMFANEGDLHEEVRAFLASRPDAWLSTGEFIDSLQLDAATRHTETLMQVMAPWPRATLELRTKHDRVEHLSQCEHPGVLVSFSINPDVITRRVEGGTADLASRLRAARTLRDRGYRIAFRLDPIIATQRYMGAYETFVADVAKEISWSEVERVYLGVLRFENDLMKRLSDGVATTELLDGEYVRCPDGKWRPWRHRRVSLYRAMTDAIRAHSRRTEIELVMEPGYVARDVGTGQASLRI